MKQAFLIGAIAIVVGISMAAQGCGQGGGRQGGAPAGGAQGGAPAGGGQGGGGGRGNMPPDFQTRMPWSSWENGYNTGINGLPPDQRPPDEPFKMFDNMYYVGTNNNSVLALTTTDGIILIDANTAGAAETVLANIKKVGLNAANIKYILISHGHNDHFGGAGRIKQDAPMARIGVSEPDWNLIELQQGSNGSGLPLKKDLVLNDMDKIKLGDTTVVAHSAPGHSIGAMNYEIPAKLGGRTYRLLNMRMSIRQANVLLLDQEYVKSIQRMIDRGPWDGLLPEHAFTPVMMGPMTAKDVYMGYQSKVKREGPNASVQGKEFTKAYLQGMLKVLQEKLAYDMANGMPPNQTVPNTNLPSPYGK